MEPKLKTNADAEFGVAVATSFTAPLPMERPKEVFPTETKSSAKPSRYKPLPFDRERVFSQDPTLCLHWLNLPLNDPLLFISQVYQQIKAMVDTYQLEHVDAFYEQYSDLLEQVLSDSEKSDRTWATTAYLRMNHKKFDRRLAHLLYHYFNAMYMLEGSLANLSILANVNGPGKFKDFGVACKVSYINTRSNRYEAFPKPVGSENFVTNYTKFAAGKTFNGATFVSIPQWVTDIYGNRGQHSFNLSDLVAAFSPTGDQFYAFDADANDYDTLQSLFGNMYEIMHQYGIDVSRTNAKTHYGYVSNILDPKNKSTAIPSTAYLENGASLNFTTANDSKRNVQFNLNYSGAGYLQGFSPVKDGEGNDVKTDNIITRAWDTFMFWSTYAETYFSAFSMPTSQIHELFMKLGYLEKSKSNVKFFGDINTDMVFDALDLRRDMIYKKDNKVNTATIVKWMPIFDNKDHSAYNSDFERNFNRCPVDLDDAFEIIKKSEEFVSITPTIFHEVADDDTGKAYPYVANTIGSASRLTDTKSGTMPAASLAGRFASLFDAACCSNIDPSSDLIETIALDPDVARDFIKRNDGIVLKDRPSSIRVFTQPLIDSTDPYQCGFNVIIASNSMTANEFEQWFKDPSNYYSGVESGVVPGYAPAGAAESGKYYTHVPTCGITDVDSTKYLVENKVTNAAYRDLVKHALVFVGDAIFTGPQLAVCRLGSGNYAEHISQGNGGTILSSIVGEFANLDTDPTSDLPNDEVITTAILKSLAIAACYADPGYPLPDTITEYKTMIDDFIQLAAIGSIDTDLDVYQFMFAPNYGLVRPIMYDVPDCGMLPTMGFEGLDTSRDPAVSFGPKQYVSNALAGNTISQTTEGNHSDFGGPQVKSRMDYDSIATAGQFLVWFVDRFQFKRLYTIGKQVYCFDDVAKLPGFSSPAKTFLSLLQRGIVFWNGVEDTLYLYSIPDDRKHQDNPSWGSIGALDFGGFIRLPTVKNKTLTAKRLDFTKPSPDNLSTQQSEALKGNPKSTTDSRDRGGSPNGKRRNKRKPRPENRKNTVNNKRESEFDPSDKSLDKAVEAGEKTEVSKLMREATSVMQN